MPHPYLKLSDSEKYEGKLLVGTSATLYTSPGNKSIKVVEIPSKFDGKEVAELGYRSFYGTEITSVFIPKTILCIYDDAFKSCTKLSEVRFEKGSKLTSLGKRVFYYCTSLKKIDFPASVSSISIDDLDNFFYSVSLECFSYEGTTDFSSLSRFFYTVTNIYVPTGYTGQTFAGKKITGRDKTCGVSKEHFKKGIKTLKIRRFNTPFVNMMLHIILS